MPWRGRVRCFPLVPLATLAAAAGLYGSEVGRQSASVHALNFGAPVQGVLSGEPQPYSFRLAAGQFTTVAVIHRDADVTVRVSGPDDEPIEMTSDGPAGEIGLPVHANTAGTLTLAVTATYPRRNEGAYTVRVADPRVAAPADRRVVEAERRRAEAVELRKKESYAQATVRAGQALAACEAAYGKDAPQTARVLLLLGQLQDIKADFPAAESFYARAVRALERAPEHELLAAQIADARAAHLIARGRFGDAESLARDTLAVRERLVGGSHALVAASLATLADLQHESGRVTDAAATAERALETARESYRPGDIVLGDFLNRVARSQLALGNYARAEELYRQSLDVREKPTGPATLAAAESLGGLARVALLSNDNAAAEERHLRSLAIRERVLGPDHPQVANDVFNLGLISYRRRDFAGALERYRRALAIREKSFGRSHPAVAVTLNNMGLVYWRQSDYVRAEEFFGRALELSEQIYGRDSLRIANSLANLGIIAKETGDYALAETRYRRALAIKEHHLGADHPELIPLVESLAILYRDRHDYAEAERMFERTISLTQNSLGAEHPFVARHLANLAQLYWSVGEWDKALAARTRVVAIEERNLPLELAIGSERQKLAFFEPLRADLEETITFHVRHPHDRGSARDLALTTVLRRKGRILEALADNISAFRNRAAADDLALLDRLSRVTAELAAAALTDSTRSPLAERQRRVEALAKDRERLEIELQARSSGYLLPTRPVTLDTVQNAIPPNAALIEFARYRPFDPTASVERGTQFVEPRYVAYVLRQSGEPRWKDLGPADVIDDAVERFRRAVSDPARREASPRSAELHQLLIGQLRPLLDGTDHLLISPDGPLNLIPFEALRGPGGRFLVEEHLISYVTTGRDLARMKTSRPLSRQIVVVADPAFGETPDDPSPIRFARLAGTSIEARRLSELFPAATIRSRNDATEQALKALRAPRILHIATHGFFKDPASAGASHGTIDNPLLRSGLALQGANMHRAGNDDGILTALEAAYLNLWGTQLVTLSACDTGIGAVRDGEGVYGLRRAFFLAGTESLVMSMWPVSDLITRDLMTGYYDGLKKGLGRGDALRQVQLKMMKRPGRSHPYYWASFIQAGEWANLDGRR